MDDIIPTPQNFMLSGSVIQALSVFQLIMTIGSCHEALPIMVPLEYCLEEEALKEVTFHLNTHHLYLS